jgi:predicted RNase H-like nuclease
VPFIGLDLAWGERARTGIAALDRDGRLVACACVRSDDEIIAFVARHAPGDCVLAIDAPLIVPNQTGQRVAERLIAQRFGRFAAGAYPANRASPLFNPVPRALRIARRLGCDPDPTAGAGPGKRVAIEVYPHSASIVLFGLDRTLPYKGRQGRAFAVRAAAFTRLIGHVGDRFADPLRPADCDRWRELAALASAASRPADIERIEDEVDAVICAYLAWLWHASPESCWVLGNVTTGYIVTPRLPDWPDEREHGSACVLPARTSRTAGLGKGPDMGPP